MTKHILYIEDDTAQIAMMEFCLEEDDYEIAITFAKTANEGLALFDANTFALVVIDYNLPDAHAPQVAKSILQLRDPFPIVFVSGFFSDEALSQAKALSIKLCLEKNEPRINLKRLAALI